MLWTAAPERACPSANSRPLVRFTGTELCHVWVDHCNGEQGKSCGFGHNRSAGSLHVRVCKARLLSLSVMQVAGWQRGRALRQLLIWFRHRVTSWSLWSHLCRMGRDEGTRPCSSKPYGKEPVSGGSPRGWLPREHSAAWSLMCREPAATQGSGEDGWEAPGARWSPCPFGHCDCQCSVAPAQPFTVSGKERSTFGCGFHHSWGRRVRSDAGSTAGPEQTLCPSGRLSPLPGPRPASFSHSTRNILVHLDGMGFLP